MKDHSFEVPLNKDENVYLYTLPGEVYLEAIGNKLDIYLEDKIL